MLVALKVNGSIPAAIVLAVRPLVFLGVMSAATNLVAMEYFWFDFDKSPSLKKALWFCVMLNPLLGAPLYCFMVYSRSDVFTKN
jgi:hypothetical protein